MKFFPTTLVSFILLTTAAYAAAYPAAPAKMSSIIPQVMPQIMPQNMPMINLDDRNAISLSGQWAYIVDRSRLGVIKKGRQRNFAQDRKATNHPLLEYDWDTSPTMTIPGDWNSQIRELNMYEGMVWFRRKVTTSPKPDKRYFLYFEAANYDTRVFLNSKLLGRHIGGFTPFEFEVTADLKAGENSLVVSVDAAHSEKTIPAGDFDWKNYGGITRPVSLIEVPETFIRDYWVRLNKTGQIDIDVRLDGPAAARAKVNIKIPGLDVTVKRKTNAEGRIKTSIPLPKGLKLWQPAAPMLYNVEISTKEDAISDRIGFRTIEVKGPKIYLNGQPLILYGISIHEEAMGEVPTRTVDEAAAKALLDEALDLGANFVRLAHYPHTELMPRLADELGLLVWSEIPVYWDIDFESSQTLAESRTMLTEMISRDKNRASIIIWSVANETPIKKIRTEFLKKLIETVRAQDSTRLITAAMDKMPETGNTDGDGNLIMVNDPIGAYIDILGINRYDGWYGPLNPEEVDKVHWKTIYDKPIMLSEFGAGALYGYRADPLTRWSEDYQALMYQQYVEMTKRIPNFAGMSPWLLKDFRSPRRFHGRFQNYWNRKGLIDPTGKRKVAFSVLQQYYERENSRQMQMKIQENP